MRGRRSDDDRGNADGEVPGPVPKDDAPGPEPPTRFALERAEGSLRYRHVGLVEERADLAAGGTVRSDPSHEQDDPAAGSVFELGIGTGNAERESGDPDAHGLNLR
jgi:hypothetical protein